VGAIVETEKDASWKCDGDEIVESSAKQTRDEFRIFEGSRDYDRLIFE